MLQIKDKFLNNKQYFHEKFDKHQIVLHHTVSSTMQSAWNWWNETEDHIATAFIIDKNGIIYRCFDEKYWAYHTGTGAHYDKHSIGIELVNEGSLIKDTTGNFKWFDGKYIYKGSIDSIFKIDQPWRGYNYFANYTNKQILSSKKLVKYLCGKYNINKNVLLDRNYHKAFKSYEGTITHANVNENKSDVSLAYSLQELSDYLQDTNEQLNNESNNKINIFINKFLKCKKK